MQGGFSVPFIILRGHSGAEEHGVISIHKSQVGVGGEKESRLNSLQNTILFPGPSVPRHTPEAIKS